MGGKFPRKSSPPGGKIFRGGKFPVTPDPFYVATYTCIDKSDFQNGAVAVSTPYIAVLPGSILANFEGYGDTYNNCL